MTALRTAPAVDAASYAALDAGLDEWDLFTHGGQPLDWYALRGAR